MFYDLNASSVTLPDQHYIYLKELHFFTIFEFKKNYIIIQLYL